MIDESARINFVNNEACWILGYTDAELLTMSVPDIDVDFPIERWPGLWNDLQIKHSLTLQGHQKTRDGRVFPVEINANYFEFENKSYIVALVRDISERKRAEEELKKIVSRLNEAQRIVHIGSWELDLTRNHLIWSDEIYRIFEIDPENFGASYEAFLNAIHPDDRKTVNFAYINSLKTRSPYSVEHRLLLSDGRIKYVHEQCETFYAHEQPIRSVGTVQDVTERKQTEQELTKYRQHLKNL